MTSKQSQPGDSTTGQRPRRSGWRRFAPAFAEGAATGSLVALALGVLLGFGGWWGYHHFISPTPRVSEPPVNPLPGAAENVAVVGDSFASGEGAQQFWKSSLSCHRTWASYAYTIATDYKLGLTFPACSGAVINDLDHESNGVAPQLDAVRATKHLRFVLVQIGGNDAQFGNVVAACLEANLLGTTPCARKGYLSRVPTIEPGLESIYRAVKDSAPNAQVFVAGYPDPFGPSYCTASEVTPSDWTFVTKVFIPELDSTIERAATQAGVHYVSMIDAFAGYGICDLPVGEAALNTISYLEGLPRHDSFHPNALGQLLMANRFEAVLRSDGIEIAAPAAPAPAPASTLIPQPTSVAGDTDTSPCRGGRPTTTLYPPGTSRSTVVLTAVLANSKTCFRINRSPWRTVTAPRSGTVDIAPPPGATSVEAIFRTRLGAWTRFVYTIRG